jgi:hypothetical protein
LDNVRIIVTAVLSGGRVSLSGDESIRRDKGKKKGARRAHGPRADARPSKELIDVSGWNLEGRLEEAFRQGDGSGGRFWLAYSFPTGPGVVIENVEGVDNPLVNHGPAAEAGEGGGGEGATASRRAALFLLFESGGDAARLPARAEVAGLTERGAAAEAASFAEASEPVFWLGEPEADESLSLISRLIDGARRAADERAAARLTDAVALHADDAGGRVSRLLEQLASGPAPVGARLRAVAWLGRTNAESAFVLEVMRDKSQPPDVRRIAARALVRQGARRAAGAAGGVGAAGVGVGAAGAPAVSLHRLYEMADSRELKAEIIMASPKRGDRQEVVQFLQEIARGEPDAALRERARWRLQSRKVLAVE